MKITKVTKTYFETEGELAALCRDIPYASSATVALAYRREQVAHALRGSGFVVPRAERGVRLAREDED